ncbi:hypothetical protein [uncultured Corynebacterium sp.]|uniref:hypothetical protein n=1 Tax=uncultured Corynebacterium sp. TaxID=159447 RepID=UPI0025E1CC20|nr:hypothetical protein [uncultured Corynebacterium sp.]
MAFNVDESRTDYLLSTSCFMIFLGGIGHGSRYAVTDSTDQKQLENFTSEQAREVELAAKLFKELFLVESGKEKEKS